MTLVDTVHLSCARHRGRIAVVGPDATCTYAELDEQANRIARALAHLGVSKGDRVGLWASKSTRLVATMQAILRLGAAYVPLDPNSPTGRVDRIMRSCGVSALATTAALGRSLVDAGCALPPCLWLDRPEHGEVDWEDLSQLSPAPLEAIPIDDDDLAYVLYTSGSTGEPKGVCLSHKNALCFVRWAVEELQAQPTDRFANHAPFHFDLSVLDLYAAFSVGASVSLVPEQLAYAPERLVSMLVEHGVTIWYSVPSALMLMMSRGALLAADAPELRAVLFAGEPFPIQHLRKLRGWRPSMRLLNLYGPTETNVCTFHEVFEIAPERIECVPIGRECCGDEVVALDDDGQPVGPGGSGELVVRGPSVMLGYWGAAPQAGRPYRTGDLVRVLDNGDYQYLGRRDQMVKVRGHRIELGEIEAVLSAHARVERVAVVAHGEATQRKLIAFAVTEEPPSLIELKRHCAAMLPRAMIIDGLRRVSALPRTATGKIDRRRLTATLQEEKQR